MAIARIPTTSMPWKVEMPRAQHLRGARIEWCRNNVEGDLMPTWVAPRAIPEKEWWWHQSGEPEVWSFRRQEDAVMFSMVWEEAE
jgi:hypothetical protein